MGLLHHQIGFGLLLAPGKVPEKIPHFIAVPRYSKHCFAHCEVKLFTTIKKAYFLNEKEPFENHENQDLPGVQISSSGINIEENLKFAN